MGITQCFFVLVIAPLTVVSQQQVLDPCGEWTAQGLRCEFGQECRLIQSYCFAQPCPPEPKCVPKRPRVSSCRYGDPVLDTNYRPLSCYPGRDCPHHTTCNTEVMDTQTTCCWTPRGTTTRPPAPPPQPSKPPPPTSDPCAVTFCLPQQTCEVRPPSNCYFGPCRQIGVCVDKPPAPPQPTPGPCTEVLCPSGFKCEERPSQCFAPGPCPLQGVCVSNPSPNTGYPPFNNGPPPYHTGNPLVPPPYHTGNPPFNNGPNPYDTGYPQTNNGYPQTNNGYPQTNNGYPQTNNGYPQTNNGYPQTNNGYPQTNNGNPPFNNGYPPINNGYPPFNAGKPTSNNGYPPSNNGYPPINNGYPPYNNGNPTPNNGNPPYNNGNPTPNNGNPPYNNGNPTPNNGNPTPTTGKPISNTGKPPFNTGNPTLNSGKPGLCPANVTGGCDINCEMDLDCDGKMKCCKHSCGSRCVAPAVTPSQPNTTTPPLVTAAADYPCSTKKCSLGMECRLHQVYCFKLPCPLQPTCVPETPKPFPQRCPVGDPALDINNKEFFCGRGTGRHVCPDSTYCNIHPSDRFAVCCYKSNTVSPNTPSAPVPTSCAYLTCRRDEVCREETPACVRSLCPAPRAVCRPITKPGTCPREMPPPFGRCTTECSMDGDCSGNQKCCGQCRRQCTDPIGPVPPTGPTGPTGPIGPTGKPGTCPTVPPGVFGVCISKCYADSECPGSQKCCGNCPRECTNPVQSVTNPQPPSKPVVKIGSCPSAAGMVGTCMQECSGDANCPGTQKCCSNGCGRSCQEPKVFYADSDPCKRQTCYMNQVCRLQHGICFQPPCRLEPKCMYKTSADTPGVCKSGYPVIDYGQRPLSCNPYNPHACPDRTVCSSGVCCWDTNTGVFPTQRPGRCPGVQGFTSWFHCSFSKGCNVDNQCDPNTKCCNSGSCGKRCMIPLM